MPARYVSWRLSAMFALAQMAEGAAMVLLSGHMGALGFTGFWVAMALTNVVAFRHLGRSERFGYVRVWGTIGWIAVSWALSLYLRLWENEAAHLGDGLLAAAILFAVSGAYSFISSAVSPFFFIGLVIAVEQLSQPEYRASAQGLLTFARGGIGSLLGQMAAGRVYDAGALPGGGHRWGPIFAIPAVTTLLTLGLFALLYREGRPAVGPGPELPPP